MIKVFGHKAPDTDATCSAIVWAWFITTKRGQDATPYVLGTPNTEALFVLKKWGHTTPELLTQVTSGDTVAIVDTNNHAELFENINEANIISIIDHHKLVGGLETKTPIEIIIQPYASTMTVMFTAMDIQTPDLPREIAGLMLSGILSDTLAFRSPTTTPRDQELAEDLARVLEVDIETYAHEMFEAKSDTSSFSESELLRMDSKIFDVGDKKLRVSVLETTNPDTVLNRKGSLVQCMSEIAREDEVDAVLLFIVDILKEESTLIVPDDFTRTIAEKSFGVEVPGDTVLLPGVVSRKKQIIPSLTV